MKKIIDNVKANIDIWCIFFFYLCLHMFMRFIKGDDPYFITELGNWNYDIWALSKARYLDWTARTVIEVVVFSIGALPKIVWRVLDSVIVTCFYCILKVMLERFVDINNTNKRIDLLLVLIFLCWPFSTMGTTGWFSSSTITLWILVGMLYAITFLYEVISGKEKRVWEYILFATGFVYSANHESTFPVYVVAFLMLFLMCIKNKYKNIIVLGCAGIVFAVNVIWAITSPGNMQRLTGEENKSGYLDVSILGKIRMGINNTFYHYVSVPNAVLFLLCLLLCFLVYKKSKNMFEKAIGLLPILLDIFWTGYIFIIYTLKRGYLTYTYPDEHFMDVGIVEQYCAMVSALVMFGTIIYGICIIWKNSKQRLFLGTVLIIGVLPELELGFTPAISASIMRVVIYLYAAFLLIIFALIIDRKDCLKKWQINAVTFCAICGTIMNLLQIIRHMIVYG